MREINKILDQNEKVLWENTPRFWPFFLSHSIPGFIIGILFFGFFSIPFISLFSQNISLDRNSRVIVGLVAENPYTIFLYPPFWIVIFLIIGPTLYTALVFKHTHYAITDKRVLLQKGWIGRDFDSIDFDKITDAQVRVGIFDKMFGGGNTGSISVSTAGSVVRTKHGIVQKPYLISSIPDPYTVFSFFKKVSHDVKTDIQYPNNLRPKQNDGYQTDYTPK